GGWGGGRGGGGVENKKGTEEVFRRGAPRPSQHLTGETADRRDQRRFTVRPGPTRRFDRPSGGTEEFLGRRVARPGSRRAEAQRRVGRSLDMCLAPPAAVGGSCNDRNSRCSHKGSRISTRYNRHNRITKYARAYGARS